MDKDYDVLFRIMILGDTGVGKTCMLQRFCDDEFRYSHVCTIGIDFKMKTLLIDGIRVRLQIWDTAGQERYRTITKQYFRKAQGIVLAYDVTNKSSFMNIRNWAEDITEYGDEDVGIVLVANKSDREDRRAIDALQGEELAAELKMPFLETSAYTSENISSMFDTITKQVLDKHKDEILKQIEKRKLAMLSESDSNESPGSEDEGIVKDSPPSTVPISGENVKKDDISCCIIL